MKDSINAIVLDVDGVLTDGTFWWNSSGEEYKRFSYLDVMGVSIGRKAGLVFALITGEETPFAEQFARKLFIEDVYLGCKDKASALHSFSAKRAIPLHNICYVGDDINDLPAIKMAGLSAAPSNAHQSVLAAVALRLEGLGGHGAVRELVDYILSNRQH